MIVCYQQLVRLGFASVPILRSWYLPAGMILFPTMNDVGIVALITIPGENCCAFAAVNPPRTRIIAAKNDLDLSNDMSYLLIFPSPPGLGRLL